MFKVIATDVVVSKGYDNTPALKFSDRGDSVRFRIGKKVYDTRAKDNHRWVNLSAKAFGPVCERIRKMQLRDGSFVNILGPSGRGHMGGLDHAREAQRHCGHTRRDRVLFRRRKLQTAARAAGS